MLFVTAALLLGCLSLNIEAQPLIFVAIIFSFFPPPFFSLPFPFPDESSGDEKSEGAEGEGEEEEVSEDPQGEEGSEEQTEDEDVGGYYNLRKRQPVIYRLKPVHHVSTRCM